MPETEPMNNRETDPLSGDSLSADGRRATIRDVAKHAGVSPAAVSLTISGRGRIAEDTRQRIWQAIHELNYRLPLRKHKSADRRHFTVPRGNYYQRGPVLNVEEELEHFQFELEQRQQEGYDILAFLPMLDGVYRRQPSLRTIEALYDRLELLTLRPDYPYVEPTTWAGIESETTQPEPTPLRLDRAALFDRLHGGWLGRCVGCTLGKPLELMGTYKDVEAMLRRAGAYPLSDYVPLVFESLWDHPHGSVNVHDAYRENLQSAPRDDDLDYTILNLRLLEQHGHAFTTEQVAQRWLEDLAYNNTYTAERIAYANLVKQYAPPETALHRNPFREFIGAQIRADIFGFTAPGDPAAAAQRAYVEARLSHVKNGVYGAMLVAAMIAAAFVAPDVGSIVQAGLAVVPRRSRLAEGVRMVSEQVRAGAPWQNVAAAILRLFPDHDPVHVLPNACIVVLALLYGDGDFERTTITAALCGLDADCNAATVGSIVGVLRGAQELDPKWTEPLHDRVDSWVRGEMTNSIQALARRSLSQIGGA